jgi:hypothetical protein
LKRNVPKYVELVATLSESLGPGIHHINVMHDKWCDLLKGKGHCNCNPEVQQMSRKHFE